MPAFCAVYGCSNRHDRERNRSFYRLPKVITHQGQKSKDLSQARREKWLTNIARRDIRPSSYGNLRICSDHFIDKPSDLYDTLNPDWAPTVLMGRPDSFCSPPPSLERYKRLKNRLAKKKHSGAAVALLDLKSSIPEKNPNELEYQLKPAETNC
ncbi:hypothetical protein SNE40_012579 [Patella caerulea]|uniref:THAP-type domain-containing protein n=1 Tax=Patella caerulea TaxID=87958 RepID=A0AAN8PNI1_PATCE